jgi:hypothetical protein
MTHRVNSVKNYNLTKSVFAALLLVSTVAGAEDKYPASDFKPTVVYQDEAVAKEAESAPAVKSAPVAATTSSSDSQYPAANFEPKVLYSDSDYKHSAASPSSASSSQASSADSTSSSEAAAPGAAKADSSAGYLLGLIVFAVAGFVLFKKGACPGAAAKNNDTSAAKASGGLTGVAKYLLKTSGTGVSRYLEKNAKNAPSTAATGVAKYLASQVSSAKGTASQAATGVEKYLRDKG